MKHITLSPKTLAFIALVTVLSVISCKKDDDTNNTPTPACPVAITKDSLLVQKTWKVDMVYHVIGGNFSKFISGVSNTTGTNYENTRFVFLSNGTGTYTNENGSNYSLTWQFTSADKRSMNVVTNTPVTNNSTWEMVELAGNYMHFSVNFNTNNMETFRLKQVP